MKGLIAMAEATGREATQQKATGQKASGQEMPGQARMFSSEEVQAGGNDAAGQTVQDAAEQAAQDAAEQAVSARIEALREEIEHHSYLYYALDTPSISDAAFDSLMRELRELEAAYPQFITASSPTQRVGGYVGEQFAPVKHEQRMYSLDNAMDLDELRAWMGRVEEACAGVLPPLCCELKIDGSSIALT
jgi:DNA ligase (NAD+)